MSLEEIIRKSEKCMLLRFEEGLKDGVNLLDDLYRSFIYGLELDEIRCG